MLSQYIPFFFIPSGWKQQGYPQAETIQDDVEIIARANKQDHG
jgi:hypothetical protein